MALLYLNIIVRYATWPILYKPREIIQMINPVNHVLFIWIPQSDAGSWFPTVYYTIVYLLRTWEEICFICFFFFSDAYFSAFSFLTRFMQRVLENQYCEASDRSTFMEPSVFNIRCHEHIYLTTNRTLMQYKWHHIHIYISLAEALLCSSPTVVLHNNILIRWRDIIYL